MSIPSGPRFGALIPIREVTVFHRTGDDADTVQTYDDLSTLEQAATEVCNHLNSSNRAVRREALRVIRNIDQGFRDSDKILAVTYDEPENNEKDVLLLTGPELDRFQFYVKQQIDAKLNALKSHGSNLFKALYANDSAVSLGNLNLEKIKQKALDRLLRDIDDDRLRMDIRPARLDFDEIVRGPRGNRQSSFVLVSAEELPQPQIGLSGGRMVDVLGRVFGSARRQLVSLLTGEV